MTRFWMVSGTLLFSVASCDDPMLPSDYSGPPSTTVAGNVVRPPNSPKVDDNSSNPGMTIEWLGGTESAPTLIGQPTDWLRTSTIGSDWWVYPTSPDQDAEFDHTIPDSPIARIATGKMFYFDDKTTNNRLDWGCLGPRCDLVTAISSEFMVFVDKPPYCVPVQSATPDTGMRRSTAHAILTRGWHYYVQTSNGTITEGGENLSFEFLSSMPVDADQTLANQTISSLADFKQALLASWAHTPC